MTADFAEDFCEAADTEKESYLLIYFTSGGGLRVRVSTGEASPDGEINRKAAQHMIDAAQFTIDNLDE